MAETRLLRKPPASVGPTQSDESQVRNEVSRRTRRSFIAAGATIAASTVAFGTAYQAFSGSQQIGTLRRPLRAAEDLNALIAEKVIGETALAPTYPATRSRRRTSANGPFGIRKDLDPASWRLQVTGLHEPSRHSSYVEDVAAWRYRYDPSFADRASHLDQEVSETSSVMIGVKTKLDTSNAAVTNAVLDPSTQFRPNPSGRTVQPQPGLLLTLADLKRFPFIEQTTEFKCIEGWSEIVTYGGIRFRDFLEAHPPARNPDGSLPKYAAFSTPDGGYFSGHEMAILLHPQTLLCFQMCGEDLTPAHGAPLRLATPLKYGYKQIKQIGRIAYTNDRPEDYWANLGYDWHGGL